MEATAWLGHWYREVAQNYAKARNCYKKVLAADPNNTVIGARPHCSFIGFLELEI